MKKMKFDAIAITSNKKSKEICDIASLCCEILDNKGLKVLLGKGLEKVQTNTIKTESNNQIIKKANLILAIGGDGTMLSCAKDFGYHGIPLLGINLGNLGFLTDVTPNEVLERLSQVISGTYKTDKRIFLEASIPGLKKKMIALNEFVVHTGSIAKMIEFDVYVDEVFVYRLKADGIIVNTVTGSTAYSLSGGGPIMHPGVDAISLVPIFPHSLSSSPFVVSSNSVIKLVLQNVSESIKVSFDSDEKIISSKETPTIKISKSSKELTLIHPKNHDFFETCRNKLGWGVGIVKN